MKKIIIALLLVFSCGILALTIPKTASASTIIVEPYFSIDLETYVDNYNYYNIDVSNTLVFETSAEKLYLNEIEIEFYCYLDYLYWDDGTQMEDIYLYYTIESVYLSFEYYRNDLLIETPNIGLYAYQDEEIRYRTGINEEDWENAERDISNLLAPHTLNTFLSIESDGYGLIYLNFDIVATTPVGDYGNIHNYFYDWEPWGDNGIQMQFPTLTYNLAFNNIIPPNVYGYQMRYIILEYNRANGTTIIEPVYITDGNFLDFIQEATNGFFDTEIFGSISIADILLFIVSVALLIFLLRFFAGG